METSRFSQLIEKYNPVIIGAITEKINGDKESAKLMHKVMLREEYSPNLTWGSTSFNNTIVAADVVSLDSSLPLKSRPSIESASGTLPKIGTKLQLDEKDLMQILNMQKLGTQEALVARAVFKDDERAINSMNHRKEIMFRQALSSGYTLTSEENNNGTGIRADFGYKDENKITAEVTWGEDGAKPLTDLRKMFDLAAVHGDTIGHVWLTRDYFNKMRSSIEGQRLYAGSIGQVVTKDALLPVPTPNNFLSYLADEYGAEFHLMEGTFMIEDKSGKNVAVQPWEDGAVIGTPDNIVGRLVYTTLAEEVAPVAGVSYQKSGTHVLVSKYSQNEPSLREVTTAQAICLPVIDNAGSIYKLSAKAS